MNQDRTQRVWLLVGVALAALFLLRTAGMIFQGAITGLGMYVALMVAFSTFPWIERLLFQFGGVSDLVVSFGLPALLSSALGITGGTMMIGTIACGLLFTFTIKTRQLGGVLKATMSSTSMIKKSALSSFEAWREEHGKLAEGRARRDRPDHHDWERRQRQEEEAGSAADRGGRRLIDVEYRYVD